MFGILIVALVICAALARRSKRAIAKDVWLLLIALVAPMFGNFLIIASSDQTIARIGCYIYYIGLDWAVVSVLRFSCDYCNLKYFKSKARIIVNAAIGIDVVQMLLNPLTGHAFTTTPIIVDGMPYHALVPLAGQVVHRIIAYGVFFVSVAIFIYMTVKAISIYREKYFFILLSMIVCGAWESYYIFSGTPVDRSMMALAVFGLLVYYFSIIYRPMRLLDSMLARIVSSLHAAVFFFDINGRCIYGNEEARALLQVEDEAEIPDDAHVTIRKSLGGWGGSFNEDWHVVRRVGEGESERYLDLHVQTIFDDKDRRLGTSLTVRDATEEEQRLHHEQFLATHDPLTGIYNQRYLLERVRDTLDANPDIQYKVVGIDIKDFKIVNDIFNKEFGDRVLCVVAEELRLLCKPGTLYGRLSGDKFGLLAPVADFSEEEMETLLTEQPYGERVGKHPIVVHMGVYEAIERDLEVSVMFDRAFMAITSIKNDFKRHVAIYDDAMRADLIWNQMISSQLETAMAEKQIQPYLQPMVDAQGNVEGAEVLVRWVHPEEGFLAPARFIPVFENNGMIGQLDMYIWECACQILRDWADRDIDFFLSVNISPKDFYFIDVYTEISTLVKKYGIDPAKLRLEITETVMMTDIENRLRIIDGLRADGFLVEMDDFGSGYSSLNMLKDIPVDILKIDMMFLYKTKDQNKAETILQTIINLSGQLGMPSITEGVETAEQLDMLVNMGCELFQGYYFAKPMPVAEFERLYRAA